MTPTEKELYNEKVSGVHALISANAEVQNEVNKNVLATLERIEQQVIKTNGRVTSLEGWRWKVIGISIGAIFVISYLIKLV